MSSKPSLVKIMFFYAMVFTFFMISSEAQPQTPESSTPQELKTNWQYRRGDSPLDTSGTFIWADTDTSNVGWQSIAYNKGIFETSIQPDNGYLWLRVRLPAKSWKDPHIFIANKRNGCELYIGGKSVFYSGEIDAPSKTNLEVPFWHMIPLAPDTGGKTLYFRIYTEDSGFSELDQVFIGSKSGFITKIVSGNIQLLIFGVLFITIGLVPLMLFIKKRDEKIYFAFALFSISFGVWAIADAVRLAALIVDLTNSQFNVLIAAPFLTPVGLCMYFEHIFGVGYKSIIRRLWQIHLAYAAATLIILIFIVIPFPYVMQISLGFFLLFFITLIVLLTTSVIAAIKGRTDARIITPGFVVFATLGLYDIIGGGFGLIPGWSQVIYPWGLLLFIFSLGVVLERRFTEAHEQLQEYSNGLEIKVEERTQDLREKNVALENTLDELYSTQTKLVQSEKMAMLGKLTAGIAHEINSPVGVLKSTMDTLTRCVTKIGQASIPEKKLLDILETNSQVAVSASDRISQIVESLKDFTKSDEAEHQKVDIHTGIESALSLVGHLLKENIKVVKKYGALQPIYCYPGQLNQVVMTLLTNAIQSIETHGTITVQTDSDGQTATIKISDTGKGVPAEQLNSLFDVRFATKNTRIVMDMGLSNVYQIIQKHNGEIQVESKAGKGTTFTILLPVNQDEKNNKK
jgi:two-component system sensor histidine kinase ChiS